MSVLLDRRRLIGGLLASGIPIAAEPAQAADRMLRIGLGSTVISMDPHFTILSSNVAMVRHLFDPLVISDPLLRPQPGLARSWRAINDTTWEFKLRTSAVFSDGSAFTSADVLVSLERAPNVPRSPSTFRVYMNTIVGVEAPDDETVLIHTSQLDPLLPNKLVNVMMISRKFAQATTADFNSGAAVLGTGPFTLKRFVPDTVIELAANPRYWAGAVPWSGVSERIITNNASRTAGLLAGDLDFIDSIPPADYAHLKANPAVRIASTASNRVVFLMLDQAWDHSPFITGPNGEVLEHNPLKDLRVRQALSMAIDRQALVNRVLEGLAIPAAQLLSDGFVGTAPDLAVTAYNPNGARKLLAEAGYPQGFRLTLQGSNDHYINDAILLQAISQMFTRIGVITQPDAMPWSRFAQISSQSNFSMILFGWGSVTGETGDSLTALLATSNPKTGVGTRNNGGYSNPTLDRLIDEAQSTVEPAKRAILLGQACKIAMEHVALIPLHYEKASWAMTQAITYTPEANLYTLAADARPAR